KQGCKIHLTLLFTVRSLPFPLLFPVSFAGIGKMDYGIAGKAMLDGMASVITEMKPKCLSLIRIVILQQPVFDLKKILPKSKSSRSGVTIPPTKPQPAVFSAIGPSSAAIASLKTALEGLVQQQLVDRDFELGDLCRLDEMEVAAVQAKARSLGVSFDHSVRRNTNAAQSGTKNQANSGDKIVILRGLKEDVLMVAELVNKAIKKALSDDLLEKEKEEVAQSVQWMYQKGGEDWEHFDLDQNYFLETAFEKKEVFLKIEFKGNKLKVNFKALDATDSKTGDKYRVKRCVTDKDIDFPGYWSPMAGENFKKVEVDPNSVEYQDIAKGFHKTAKYKIHKIERVQNYHLWSGYFVMRRKMEMKNSAAELGEKYLYHGTSAESCHCIERDRFDRNYTGAHGASYGAGVYFAINASYSANSRYAKPDPAGLKRMYVARVLTGHHTLGDSSMKSPPQRGDDPSDKYDSLVDNLQSPSMYVIFHDDQAYPEYLITFI
uniref:Poly [ADP-ribose] polymerase n=1 Tax=Neogobius melanostomus TaxID=47308 RepID=A0A8C6T9V8_9GOBI